MKKHYRLYNETLPFEADINDLKELLGKKKQLLENYIEISSDLYDEIREFGIRKNCKIEQKRFGNHSTILYICGENQ